VSNAMDDLPDEDDEISNADEDESGYSAATQISGSR